MGRAAVPADRAARICAHWRPAAGTGVLPALPVADQAHRDSRARRRAERIPGLDARFGGRGCGAGTALRDRPSAASGAPRRVVTVYLPDLLLSPYRLQRKPVSGAG